MSRALACGFLAARYRERFVLWATALGGAGLAVASIGSLLPDVAELHASESAGQIAFAVVVWLAVTVAGWLAQRALFARRLHSTNR